MTELADLALRTADGDATAFAELAAAMRRQIAQTAARYYAPGLERDDLRQAALVGLWRGCLNYDPERKPADAFTAFATLCMKRSVITAVKTATCLKHQTLAGAASLDAQIADQDGELGSLHDRVASRRPTAQTELEIREEIRVLTDAIENDLTPLERETLIGITFEGDSYADIEARLDRTARSVDNAFQRARRKLRRRVDEHDIPLGAAA